MNEPTITLNVDTTALVEQMEMIQKQVDEVSRIIVESWKPIELFLYYNRNTINRIAVDLDLITMRRVNPRASIRRYYKYTIQRSNHH